MTTKVTVDAHAGWPVEVKYIRGEPSQVQTQGVTIVDPNTVMDFYIHSGMFITEIRELQK